MTKKGFMLLTSIFLLSFSSAITEKNKELLREIEFLQNEIANIDMKIYEECTKIYEIQKRVEEMEFVYPDEEIEEAKDFISMNVKATAYCNELYPHICNDGIHLGKTATGKAVVGSSLAVDLSDLTFNKRIF